MNYKIYQYNYNNDKYFIYQYNEASYSEDRVHGMELSKNKETGEWRIIYHTSRDQSSLDSYYHPTGKTVSLDNLIINHILGALDIT